MLFSSLEMSPAELMHRRIAATAKVSMDALTKHRLSERDWDRINAAHDRLAGSPLVVDGKEGASLAHIRARLRGMTRGDNPVRAAVIDQVGLMDAGRAENRQVAVAGLSRGVKNLAREFNIPVLLLVQINRARSSGPTRCRPCLTCANPAARSRRGHCFAASPGGLLRAGVTAGG